MKNIRIKDNEDELTSKYIPILQPNNDQILHNTMFDSRALHNLMSKAIMETLN